MRVPELVLRLVFLYCLPREDFIVPHKSRAPLLLTLVCKDWRRVAFDMSSLWRSLSVDQYQPKVPTTSAIISWLKHSKELPLSLRILQPPGANQKARNLTKHVVKLFLDLIHRWEYIDIDIAEEEDWVLLRYIPWPMVPQETPLKAISFNVPLWDDQQTFITHTGVFPHIRDVRWRAQSLPSSLPLSRLTNLHVETSLSTWEYLTTLRHCAALEILKIWGLCDTFHPIDSFEQFELGALSTLEIKGDTDVGPFFEAIVAKQLKSLSVFQKDVDPLPARPQGLLTFFRDSAPRLDQLILVDPFRPERDFITIFEYCEGIRELTLHSPHLTDRTLAPLLMNAWRNLRRLTLGGFGTYAVTPGHIGYMVSARWDLGLKFFQSSIPSRNAVDIRLIQDLINKGLEAHVYFDGI